MPAKMPVKRISTRKPPVQQVTKPGRKRPAKRVIDDSIAKFKKIKSTLKVEKYNAQIKKANAMKKTINKIILEINKEVQNKSHNKDYQQKYQQIYLREKLEKNGITAEYLRYSGFSYEEVKNIYGAEKAKKVFSHYFIPPL